MVSDRAVEQQCFRRDDIVGVEAVGPGNGFVVISLLTSQRARYSRMLCRIKSGVSLSASQANSGRLGPACAGAAAKLDQAR